MEKMKDLNEIKHRLIDWVKTETVKGFESPAEVEIMGEVVDMIKDLAEAEESCMEAAYYEVVSEAMTGYDEREGYDNWRYASGRFAPTGRGTRTGYEPGHMMPYDTMGYESRSDGRMAPGMGAGRTMGRTDGRGRESARYGYPTPLYDRMGYDDGRMDEAMETVREAWDDADHETRKKLKGVVQDLLHQMEQAG